MSVYVDMEMPKSCESCPCKTADAFGGLGCQATGYIPLRKANQDRPDWCPLVEVPEPHGRLGDLDDIIKRAKKWIDHPDEYIKQRNKDMIYILEREDAVIPASEEAE